MPVIPDETSVYGHVDENRHMIESFMDEKMPRENWNDSLFVVKLLMTCYMSAERGKTELPSIQTKTSRRKLRKKHGRRETL